VTPRSDRPLHGRPWRALVLAGLVAGAILLAVALAIDEGMPEDRGGPSRPVNPAPSPLIGARPVDDQRSPGAPAAPREAHATARRFLRGYLAFLYGRANAGDITDITEPLHEELERSAPRVPPAQRQRRPRVIDLRLTRQAPAAVLVTATVDDGDVAVYPLVFTLDRRGGRWRVSRLAND
jgi:hypothetical protein